MDRSDDVTNLKAALLAWYAQQSRLLPWRAKPGKLPDPYAVLVSEAMLQQTQVATVVGYFQRFMKRWPTVDDLAATDEQDVLHLWQGLGYYRRARHLHRAAQVIVKEHGGQLPDDVASLLKLPGVGAYTAGAIASIGFGKAEPLVDGNVVRVLARWFALEGGIGDAAGKKRFWDAALRMVEIEVLTRRRFSPGDWNQAVMELGALVCTPRAPRCDDCPVATWCAAKRQGRVDELPTPRVRTRQIGVVHRVAALRRDGRWLVRQRGDGGLWAGLWELATEEREVSPRPSSRGLRAWVHDQTGLEAGPMKLAGMFDHMTTHRRIRFEIWVARVQGGRLRRGAGRWCTLDQAVDLAMSNPQRQALKLLAEKHRR
ncbi:A/G-specific adenine glycosylase [Planctomycetales bacterium ZRK34]|nr:A/G-specific adenine glycosylase [Planctomycetales bacterium ZRK34]